MPKHRLISLINHLTKIFTKVIHNRIYAKCDSEVDYSQLGFRNTLGTRDAIFALQVLIQRCRDTNKDVYSCFIDFSKAFDSVNHELLISILKKVGLDSKDIRMTTNLKVGTSSTEKVEIKKAQGCILYPLLFNRYTEEIFREALHDANVGIKLNGELISNIRNAHDTAILASSIEELQRLLRKIQAISEQYGLKLNVSKTKRMVISKRQQQAEKLILKTELVEQVEKYCYFGSLVNSQWDQSMEIR